MNKKRFKLSDLKGFTQIARYIRPHRLGFSLGILLISLSGVLTLLVTRLWGQLGGVGVLGGSGGIEATGIEADYMEAWGLNDLETIGWAIGIILIITFV